MIYTREQFIQRTLSKLMLSPSEVNVEVGDPFEVVGRHHNTEVKITFTGKHIRETTVKCSFDRVLFEGSHLPFEYVYEEEEDNLDFLYETLLARQIDDPTTRQILISDCPSLGQVKDYLDGRSPITEFTIDVSTFGLRLQQRIRLAPRLLDVKYVINHTITLKDGKEVSFLERYKEEEDTPIWSFFKTKIDAYTTEEQTE